jgi:hypothetical protein
VSDRHPYMFSCGLDKMVKCWDLEYNKARPPPPPRLLQCKSNGRALLCGTGCRANACACEVIRSGQTTCARLPGGEARMGAAAQVDSGPGQRHLVS